MTCVVCPGSDGFEYHQQSLTEKRGEERGLQTGTALRLGTGHWIRGKLFSFFFSTRAGGGGWGDKNRAV